MQEKQTLPKAPKWGRSKLVSCGCSLVDAIGQSPTHMMQREI